ncbi:thiol:disulfide interchange protein tlpA [Clostridium folliculivorans]|uniref:Thiol:disulfide interchange protein tlpA n=1 Tax=Clostridium folliculivorans TaxID=2886038 RepID=A0A9W6DCK1_9CLOT|nr:TlpA disulfide reductase family protein [Clostridium folliculivorans]GKU27585.1 thiol:disulfide interchange protein tlpA [Clostridium folliculivorans]
MKKLLFPLSIIILFSLSLYTVINYNKTKSNSYNAVDNKKASDNNNISKTPTTNSTNGIFKDPNGDKAIDFKLKTLDGKEVSLSELKGKNVFINFWATWCPYCVQEMPEIEKLYQETKNSDLIILGIDIGEDNDTVRDFLNKNKLNFNILFDYDESVATNYNITALPTSLFIDKNGTIIKKKIGPMTLEEMKSYVNLLK